MPVPNTFGTATTSIPLSQLDANFNTPVTIGSTSVGLGNTVTTVANLTLTNATISSGNVTVTTGVFGAGSNTAPSITTTGDTNTGIFFPSADTIAFTEGGVESMRIDSSGNVGIGASPSFQLDVVRASASTPQVRVQNTTTTSQTNSLTAANDAGTSVGMGVFGSAAGTVGMIGAGAPIIGTAATELNIYANNGSGVIKFATGGLTERMRINSSGDVGIGTSSPGVKLDVVGASGIRVRYDTSGSAFVFSQPVASGGDGYIVNQANSNIIFGTNNSERARIDSSGNLGIGTTSPTALLTASGSANATKIQAVQTAAGGYNFASNATNNSGTYYHFDFTEAGTQRGSITSNGSATAYNTGSDYRLKENIAPMVGALNVIAQLKPSTFTWKSTGKQSQGFIAHELQAVVPDAVVGQKDAVNEDGSIKPQGIDTSFLVATLTAAIQELNAKVEAQAAEIALLKSK